MSDINSLLETAIKETDSLYDGEIFLLRDLFKGYEWNRISRSTRLLLGTLFLNKITSENLEIEASAKTSSGQQDVYKRQMSFCPSISMARFEARASSLSM